MFSSHKKSIFSIFIFFLFFSGTNHPIYVSITEIEHNSNENILQVSCKIFTNDFESVLRKSNSIKVDLIHPSDKKAMDAIVEKYISNHLKINVDGVNRQLNFVGYEQSDDSIDAYFQIDGIKSVKKISVTDNILYEYKSEQISIIHTIVKNQRKSTKLTNPASSAVFEF